MIGRIGMMYYKKMNNNAFEHLHHHIDVHALEEGGHSHAQSSKAGVLPTFLLSIQGFRIFFLGTGIELGDMWVGGKRFMPFATALLCVLLTALLGVVLCKQMSISCSAHFYNGLSCPFSHK